MARQRSPLRDEEVIARVSMPDQQQETSEADRFFDDCLATRGIGWLDIRGQCRIRVGGSYTRSLSRTKLFWADSAPPTRSFGSGPGVRRRPRANL